MKKINLKTQVMIGCILFTIILTAAIGVGGFYQYKKNITQKYHDYADTLIRLAEASFDENNMIELVKKRSMGKGYDETRKTLNTIKENSDIAYIFAIFFKDTSDLYSLHFVMNGATKEDLKGRREEEVYSYMAELCSDSDFDDPMRQAYLDTWLSGSKDIHYYENVTDEYGHMLTCYKVLYDRDNEPVCILSVDMDVNEIQANLDRYITRMLVIAALVMILLLVTFVWVADRFVTDPVTRIARSADRFVHQLQRNTRPEDLNYDESNLRHANHDIRLLSEDVSQMATSIKDYMENLQSVTKEKERVGAELELATRIQYGMLPKIFPLFTNRPDFDIAASMDPAKEVGGDFYDFFMIDEDHIALVMADVSGKGVPAALFMMIAKTLLKHQLQTAGHMSPAKALGIVNDQLCEGNDSDFFVTIWAAVLNLSTGDGVAANAGHEHPAIRRAGGNYELSIYRHSPAVASMEGMKFREHDFHLDPGDSIFVYTDGVPEATNASEQLLGNERMVEALNRDPDAVPGVVIANVTDALWAFVGDAPQFDDITMLAFLYKGRPEK